MMTKHKKSGPRILSFVLTAAMIFTLLPSTAYAAESGKLPGNEGGLSCHPAHDGECGYMEEEEGIPCAHLNADGTYSCGPGVSGNEAVPNMAEDSVCHHNDGCGYGEKIQSAPCTHVCEICLPENNGGPAQPQCTCTIKCITSVSQNEAVPGVNVDCLFCSGENADLSQCMGEMSQLFEAKGAVKRTAALFLQNSIITDNSGNEIAAVDGVYDKLDSEGWKYDSRTKVLTLSGADFEVSDNNAIAMTPNSSIELIGENFITASYATALVGYESLSIGGSGSLTISSPYTNIFSDMSVTVTGGTLNLSSDTSNGIYCPGDITITGGVINGEANGDLPALWADGNISFSGGKASFDSAKSNGIGASQILSVSGTAEVSAAGGEYPGLFAGNSITVSGGKVNASTETSGDGIWCDGTVEISGGEVNASSSWGAGIAAQGALTVKDTAVVTVSGTHAGIQSKGDMILGGGTVNATGALGHSIYTDGTLTIEGTAQVTAHNEETQTEGLAAILSMGDMTITGGTVSADSAAGAGIYTYSDFAAHNNTQITANAAGSWPALYAATGIDLDGLLEVSANDSTAIMTGGIITVGETGDISAVSSKEGGMYGSEGIVSGGTIDAVGGGNSGMISYGTIQIDGGKVHAKGGPGTAAIFTYVGQEGTEEASSGIFIANLIEKNGAKASFSQWTTHNGSTKSWSSFIAEEEIELSVTEEGTMHNALNEINLAEPYTVTFDADGGSGTFSEVKVYPGNTAEAPDAEPEKDGCHFSGWYLDGTKFDFDSTAITQNIILKAQLDTHTANGDDGDCTTPVTCIYCGTVMQGANTHQWDTAWAKDISGHWHTCQNTGCSQRDNNEAHIPGEGATVTRPQLCTVCGYETAPKLPSKDVIQNDNTGITVKYEDGSLFDASLVLSVTSESQTEMDKFKDAVNSAAPGLSIGGLFNVKLLRDGVAVQPDGKVKVSIPLTAKLKEMTELKVVFIDDNGNAAIVESRIDDGKIVFVTDHFSYYGVVGKEKAAPPDDPGKDDNQQPDNSNNSQTDNNDNQQTGNIKSPLTGESNNIFLCMILIFASAGMLIILAAAAKRRKAYRD